MNAYNFISALDEARYGRRRVREDHNAVAETPSHAPKSSAGYTTPSSGKSKDEGEKTGSEKDAIKKSSSSIPTPIAKAPSHAPTSGKDYTTSGKGSSEDQGEKISKEAMKEGLLNQIMNAEDEEDIQAILGEADLMERGAHKPGCKCGFCVNKGSFGKKKEKDGNEGEEKDEMDESQFAAAAASTEPPRRRIGGPARMGFRHPSIARPKPKAAMAPYQPSMESLDSARSSKEAIQGLADQLLEAPE